MTWIMLYCAGWIVLFFGVCYPVRFVRCHVSRFFRVFLFFVLVRCFAIWVSTHLEALSVRKRTI